VAAKECDLPEVAADKSALNGNPLQTMEAQSRSDICKSSERHDWETAPEVFDVLNREFGFTIDPASLSSSAADHHPAASQPNRKLDVFRLAIVQDDIGHRLLVKRYVVGTRELSCVSVPIENREANGRPFYGWCVKSGAGDSGLIRRSISNSRARNRTLKFSFPPCPTNIFQCLQWLAFRMGRP
jgi:hypothetical protein